ncbi:MAG: ribosomal protein S18-alanine N-acetyltransferase [Eubacterium sp.]|nr:ribosomal protein S18-alanine N-acetyltransferase [Eubacterium sp.]MEE3399513.1 ribosomal protein S18-alanine N-acetyltransferase [Eubacterium sp.]
MSIFQDIAKLEKDNFSDAWSEKSLEDTFEYDYNHLLVEKRDGKVVGYVIYSDVQGEAELLRIAVDKAYRRRGIAALLMQNMLDELTESGAERVSLEVRAHNISAVTLYKKFGFIDIFIRENYYTDPVDDALIFQLHF